MILCHVFTTDVVLFSAFDCFWLKQKKPVSVELTGFCFSLLSFLVELAGIEPASKQGTHRFSTCLSVFVFSDHGWQTTADRDLISLFSPLSRSLAMAIPVLISTTGSGWNRALPPA